MLVDIEMLKMCFKKSSLSPLAKGQPHISPGTKSALPSVCINKVLLEGSCVRVLTRARPVCAFAPW